MFKPDITSPYYPYFKVQEGFFNFEQYALFPRKICDYLIDAPKGDYKPIDDNKYPRCRLWKYLYYDTEKPLTQKLPTINEKMSVIFNPENPAEPPTERGYRLIPQEYIKQSQENAQTRIYLYMGRAIASQSDNKFTVSVVFDIFTHYKYELNTKSDEYSRSGAITAALIESLNGVNMDGIGTFSMSKHLNPESGTRAIFDGKTNVGQQLIIGLEMSSVTPNIPTGTNNMPSIGNNIKIV